ncbi:hypothetical protein KTH_46570 [Thermosporothrix hazakensis]|uniref:Uncharacterized protein n=1 Tax=Thermosporothrix sp. COM3 TaxID=2490863 RepID=A0A455T2Q9_9CHLR|nr:hypothetical protein KTC_63950 [Thermosporothrix sp. COM3]GCE49788.1 hypothetical protein KTH_46570 [Thermosporothrix hazakensis]
MSETGYQCTATLIQYGVNIRLTHRGKSVTLSLFYNSKKRSWNIQSSNEWVKAEIFPKVQSLLEAKKPPVTEQSPIYLEPYFREVCHYMRLLEPFADEYIDFSLLFEYTRRAIKQVLLFSTIEESDRVALQELLDVDPKVEFVEVKEYLTTCMKICKIPGMM